MSDRNGSAGAWHCVECGVTFGELEAYTRHVHRGEPGALAGDPYGGRRPGMAASWRELVPALAAGVGCWAIVIAAIAALVVGIRGIRSSSS